MRRRFHTHGHAIPHVQAIHMTSPNVHAGFDTDLPTFRTSNGLSRPMRAS
ncbi:hypothetical protein ACIBQ1_09935 [Nonomuraea sp. NPDC050153]